MSALASERPGLLVSVRSVEEAEAALAGGADLIDVKEPSRGSLGRADDATIAAVVRAVGGRRPVSAAMGELPWMKPHAASHRFPLVPSGLAYVKWGLAGWGRRHEAGWHWKLIMANAHLKKANPSCKLVVVAYADWQRADAPPADIVCSWVRYYRWDALLLDTFCKDGSTLLDWMSVSKLDLLCRLCRNASLPVALAGSIGLEHIRALHSVQPTWFAVRGAACSGGRREGKVDGERVRQLVDVLTHRPLSSQERQVVGGTP